MSPTPRVGPALRRSTGPAEILVTSEIVEAVLEGGRYRVRGRALPVSGVTVIAAGQRVPVAWKNGQPHLILAHSARRAKFGPPSPPPANPIVEEMFVAPDADTGLNEVWFRNYDQVTNLKIASQITESNILFGRIGWAQAFDNEFWVKPIKGVYYRFLLTREIGKPYEIGVGAEARLSERIDLRTSPQVAITLTLNRREHSAIQGEPYTTESQTQAITVGALLGSPGVIAYDFGVGATISVIGSDVAQSQTFIDEQGHLIVRLILTILGALTPGSPIATYLYDVLVDVTAGTTLAHSMQILPGLPGIQTDFGDVPMYIGRTPTPGSINLVRIGGTGSTGNEADQCVTTYFHVHDGASLSAGVTGLIDGRFVSGIQKRRGVVVLAAFPPGLFTLFPFQLDGSLARLDRWTHRHLLFREQPIAGGTAADVQARLFEASAQPVVIGTSTDLYTTHDLVGLAPDFLYARAEADRFFAEGWDFDTGAVKSATPLVRDGALLEFGTLEELPEAIAADPPLATEKAIHALNDRDALRPLGRFRES